MSEKTENEAVVCLRRAGGPDWSPRKLLKRFSIFQISVWGLFERSGSPARLLVWEFMSLLNARCLGTLESQLGCARPSLLPPPSGSRQPGSEQALPPNSTKRLQDFLTPALPASFQSAFPSRKSVGRCPARL